MGKLTDVAVKNAKPGRHQDGDGLSLLVKPKGAKYWVLRTVSGGKRVGMGLGAYPDVPLAEARRKATALRDKAKAGEDILGEKRSAAATAAEASARTFEAVAMLAHAARNGITDKTNALWLARLKQYAFPLFGDVPVAKVEAPVIIAALEPIWHAKPETARRLRRAISSVLKFAYARQWRGPVPPLTDLTKDAFPTPQAALEHHPAVDYLKAPAIVAKLREEPATIGRLALLFTIFTAVRSGETRLATWSEIDLVNAEWTIPAARMKKKRELVVPLSAPALVILESAAKLRVLDDEGNADPNALVFPGERAKRPMSDMTMAKAHKLAAPGTVPHGWRSTFRDWASETTDYPAEVCEAALAHLFGNSTTRAYQRGGMLEKRRALMNDWATYLAPAVAETVCEAPARTENIVAFAPRRRRITG